MSKQRDYFRLGGVLVFILLCVGAGVWMFSSSGPAAQKQQFQKVQQDLQTTQTLMERSFGDTTAWSIKPTCSRGHEVYQQTQAHCIVELTARLSSDDPTMLKAYVSLFHNTISASQAFTQTGEHNVDLLFLDNLTPGHTGLSFTNNKTNMQCGSLIELTNTAPHTLDLGFSCGMDTIDTYFPRSDQ